MPPYSGRETCSESPSPKATSSPARKEPDRAKSIGEKLGEISNQLLLPGVQPTATAATKLLPSIATTKPGCPSRGRHKSLDLHQQARAGKLELAPSCYGQSDRSRPPDATSRSSYTSWNSKDVPQDQCQSFRGIRECPFALARIQELDSFVGEESKAGCRSQPE